MSWRQTIHYSSTGPRVWLTNQNMGNRLQPIYPPAIVADADGVRIEGAWPPMTSAETWQLKSVLAHADLMAGFAKEIREDKISPSNTLAPKPAPTKEE